MTYRRGVYMSNLTFNTISSLACVGGSGAKGQSEHGSVEMPVGWTMSFPQPLLKDRALPLADKTFRLNARSRGSQLSWGFPSRPRGQEFHPFPAEIPILSFFPPYLPVAISFFPFLIFQASVSAMKSTCTSVGLFFLLSHFLSPFSCLLSFENQIQGRAYPLISAYNFPVTHLSN